MVAAIWLSVRPWVIAKPISEISSPAWEATMVAPRDDEGRELLLSEEEGVLNDDAGGGIGGVGELQFHGHVSGRVDVGGAGLEGVADGDALAIVGDAGFLKIETFDIGGAADTDENLIHNEFFGAAVFCEVKGLLFFVGGDLADFEFVFDLDAFFAEGLFDNGGGFGIFAVENGFHALEKSDFGTEAAEGLGEFASDGTGTDDGEAFGKFGEREDRFVAESATFPEPGNGDAGGPGPSGDGGFFELKDVFPDGDAVRVEEVPFAEKDIDAEFFLVALGAIDRGDSGAKGPHAFHNGGEIDGDLVGMDPRAFGLRGGIP